MNFSIIPYVPNVPPCILFRLNYRIICDDKHKSSKHNNFNYISSIVRKVVTREIINSLTSLGLTIRGNESYIKISDIIQKNLKVYRRQSIRGMLWIEANFQVKRGDKAWKRSKVVTSVQGRELLFLLVLEGKQRW